ncbi:unnamed protein product [Closterium sp. NIES-64]|nr:unnamed protein product [Closterium sp. NIES-64]CAI5993876.1 unnamed protein product [Closterium sp. NIES-65]
MGLESGMTESRMVHPKYLIADARPLGLAGFAATTFVLSAHNAGWAPDTIWIGMAFFYGGLGQFVAGMWQFKRNCTFTATAFSTYGCFWMANGLFHILLLLKLLPPAFETSESVAWFLTSFLIFNTYMCAASLLMPLVEVVVFLMLELTLFTLMVGNFKGQKAGASGSWTMAGGYIGVFTAAAAFYYSMACCINTMMKRPTVFVGKPLIATNDTEEAL